MCKLKLRFLALIWHQFHQNQMVHCSAILVNVERKKYKMSKNSVVLEENAGVLKVLKRTFERFFEAVPDRTSLISGTDTL